MNARKQEKTPIQVTIEEKEENLEEKEIEIPIQATSKVLDDEGGDLDQGECDREAQIEK